MVQKLNNWILGIFSIIWIFLISMDYWNKHPGYENAFKYFKYQGLVIFLIIIMGILAFAYTKGWLNSILNRISLPFLYLLSVPIFILVIFPNKDFGLTPLSYMDLLSFVKKGVVHLLIVSTMFFFLYNSGKAILNWLGLEDLKRSFSVSTAVGLLIFCLLMFFVAASNTLKFWQALICFLLVSGLGFKSLLGTIKNTLIKPVLPKQLNLIGIYSLLFLGFFLAINFLSNEAPFPSGFDSRNFYANIARLISIESGLVECFQPYNWSLFMSFGHIFFDSSEITLILSFSAFVLSLRAIYELGVNYLKLNANLTLFICALIATTPAIVNQLFIELKVDFGLLFYQLCMFIVFLSLTKLEAKEERIHLKHLIIIGAFAGFGLGIKLIMVFMLLALICLMWWKSDNIFGSLGVLLISVAILIFAGIDELSGLKAYHHNVFRLSLITGGLGAVSVIYSAFIHRTFFVKQTLKSLIVGFTALLVFSPWLMKNYTEARTKSIRTLFLGSPPGPDIDALQIMETYRQTNKKK